MSDESHGPEAEPAADPRRVRRRRSSSRSRRPRQVQSRVPFTGLRFMRPRLPTTLQALGLICALIAFGLSLWTLRVADRASLTLAQAHSLLAMNTRGAAAGRLAADQLAAQAQLDAAQMMASQDAAARAQARAPSGLGLGFGGGYGTSQRPRDEEGEVAPGAYGQTSYGAAPYGSPPYGQTPYGVAQPAVAPAAPGGNVMGYTLPQASPR